nr:hypothetical protein [Tanacetum cinerariifolium]
MQTKIELALEQSQQGVSNDVLDNPCQTLKRKDIVDSGCSRHMTWNKAYLVDFQDFNGGLVTFGGSKGQITDSMNYRPIAAENKANKTTGPKETNNSAELKANNRDEKLNEDTDLKTNEEPVDQADQTFLEELESLKRQEKEANDAAETLKKTFAQSTEDLLLQAGTVRASSTNYKAIGTKWINRNKKDKRGGVVRNKARAWYATLSTFLVQSGYRRGLIDKTLFIKKDTKDIMLVQVYVDDIIFGSTKKSWCDEFETLMKKGFQMSFMEILKKFDFLSVKTASTPIETKKPLVKDEEAADVDVPLYRSMISSLIYLTASRPGIMYSVCACFRVTPKTSHLQAVKRIFRKSTTGGCQFLGRRLISWQCKKQTIVATLNTEAKYVAAASYCGQVL